MRDGHEVALLDREPVQQCQTRWFDESVHALVPDERHVPYALGPYPVLVGIAVHVRRGDARDSFAVGIEVAGAKDRVDDGLARFHSSDLAQFAGIRRLG